MSKAAFYLWVFVAAVVGDLLALMLDLALSTFGLRTITATVQLYPWLGVPLMAWQLAGGLALYLHLYGRK